MSIKNITYLIFFISCRLFGQNQVIKENTISLMITNTKNDIQIKESHKKIREVLENNGKGMEEYIHYSNFVSLDSYNAYNQVKRLGKKDKIFKVKDYNDRSATRRGIFMSDSRVLYFNYPNTIENATCVLEYTKQVHNPRFLGPYSISGSYFTKDFNFKLSHPVSVNIGLELMNCDSYEYQFTTDTVDNIVEYSIHVFNIPPVTYPSKVKALDETRPAVNVWIKSYQTNSGVKNIGNNYKDVYAWYTEILETRANAEPNAIIKQKVDDLIKDCKSPKQRLDTIYKWVQNSIEYLAFGDDLNGFIPRSCNTIYDSRYGDCKDMSNLLRGMLNYANIPSYLTWVGTRDISYKYTDFPTISVDNHLICTAILDSQYYFLDATHKHLLSEEVRQDIQGKQALLGFSSDSCRLIELPIQSKELNLKVDSLKMEIKNNTLTCKSNSDLFGYYRSYFFSYDNYAKFTGEKETFLLSDFFNSNCHSVKELKWIETDSCIRLNFNYQVDNQILSARNDLYINFSVLNLSDRLKVKDLESRLKYIDEGFKFKRLIHTEFTIPEGYEYVNNEQTDELVKSSQFTLNQTLTEENGKLYIDLLIEVDFIRLEPEMFKLYKLFLEQLKNIEEQKIQFKKHE